jgi:hypothetical protein
LRDAATPQPDGWYYAYADQGEYDFRFHLPVNGRSPRLQTWSKGLREPFPYLSLLI